jgi:hypothetical protein
MNKNAYEIRLEVLKMAKEMMDQQYSESSNAYWNTINNMAETWGKSAEELIKQTQAVKPAMYTPTEIMEKAQELYGFISESHKSK